jgi:hypothetical protein
MSSDLGFPRSEKETLRSQAPAEKYSIKRYPTLPITLNIVKKNYQSFWLRYQQSGGHRFLFRTHPEEKV